MKSRFDIVDVPAELSPDSIVLRDIGHSDGYATVSNDAEAVVEAVLRIARNLNETISHNTPPIYCYDSDGTLFRLEHDGAGFMGFGGVKSHG